ncbi:RNA-directed DNA polymerase from mobile element jockey, partial [Diplonema papillatum]
MLIFAQETTPGATTQHSAQPAGPLYLSLDYYIGETTADEKEARSTAPAGDPDLPGLPPTNRRKDRSNDAPTSQLHRIAPEIAHPTATASQPGSEQAAPSTAPPGTEAHIATTHTAADEQHPEGTKGPSAQTTARTNFFVQGLDGKRHLVAAHLDERLGDVLERHMPANLEAYVIRGSGAPLPLDQPLESIGFESGMSPGVAVCARMHGGGGGGRGKVHVRVVRPGAAHATHSAAGAGGRGGRGHAGGGDPRAGHHANTSGRGSTNVDDKRTTQRPTPERNQQPEANNRDEQGGHKLYGGWEWPETRFRYVLPWTETSGSWEEVTRQPYSWAQSCLHRTVNRNIINSCWNDSAETSFTKGELHRELRMEFSTPQANEEEVLRCSGHGGFIERTEHDDDTPSPYVNIMLNEGTALHEAHEIASRISDWQLGLTYCRGTLGIRVRREQAKQLRAQLPEAPPEVGYFLVSGVPCGTNAHHLRAKLDSLGWTAQPLFKTAKNGRHIEWAVKSEVLPGKYNHTTHDGIRLTIRRTKRLPLEPTGPNRCPRLSNELRSAETHRRHDPSRPKDNDRLSFQQFQARHGNKAATVWEIAGALDADRPEIDEFDEGAPFAGGELVGAADDDEAGREGGSPQTNPPSINNDGGNSPPNNGQLVVCTDSIFRRPISKEAERAMFCIAMRDRERRREDKVLEGVPRKALPTTTRVDERAKAHSTQAILQKRESAEKRTRRRNSLPAPASPPTPLPIIRDPATPTHPRPPAIFDALIKIASSNIRSWWAKQGPYSIEEVTRGIRAHAPDIVLLQETWLTSTKPTPNVAGYVAYRRDRKNSGKRGGGLVILVRSSLISRILPELDFGEDTLMECLGIEIDRVGLPSVRIYNVYRPPEDGKDLKMDPLAMNERTIICGDLNTRHPSWCPSRVANQAGTKLHAWLSSNAATVWNEPTTPTRDASNTSPDVTIAAGLPHTILNWRTEEAWGADHRTLMFDIPRGYRHRKETPRAGIAWGRADWKKFTEHLENTCAASPEDETTDPHELAATLTGHIRDAIREHIPKSTGKLPPRPWWDKTLTPLSRSKDAAFRSFQQQKTEHAKTAYEEARARFAEAALHAKTIYWGGIVDKVNRGTDLGLLFRTVREIDGKKTSSTLPPLRSGERTTTDPAEKATLLAKYYANVCKKKTEPTPTTKPATPSDERQETTNKTQHNTEVCKKKTGSTPTTEPATPSGKRQETANNEAEGPITLAEIERAVEKLKAKASTDPEGLCPQVYKAMEKGTLQALLKVINASWDNATIPKPWKEAHAIPLPKPGKDKSEPAGYRPISLTSVAAKIMETVIRERLDFIIEGDSYPHVRPFTECQGGFRKGRGTEEQLFKTVTTVDRSLRDECHTCLLVFDLAKAFDTVDHDRLIAIMKRRGIPPKIVRWVEAFLQDRKAKFRVEGKYGEEVTLESGVPQGTVLGPVLFLLYIDDLGEKLSTMPKPTRTNPNSVTPSLFADDVGVVVAGRSAAGFKETVQRVVNALSTWASEAKMDLAYKKTEAVQFRPID